MKSNIHELFKNNFKIVRKKYIYSLMAILSAGLCSAQLSSISQAEYFWGNDPGEGNGIAIFAADQNYDTSFERIALYGLGAPSVGLHKFSVRVKDNLGNWSPTFSNIIRVEPNSSPTPLSLTQAEYFWDADPGEGNGTPILAADQNFDSAFEKFLQSGIPIVNPIGLHIFNVRVKDNQGIWGPIFKNVIYIETTLNVTPITATDNYYFYPNPASNMIRFNKEIKKVEIYDLNGRFISTSVANEINISDLTIGTYLLKVTTPEGITFNKKMIKR